MKLHRFALLLIVVLLSGLAIVPYKAFSARGLKWERFAAAYTYQISGRVANTGGGGQSGVTVAVAGGASTTTDSQGNYTLAGLAPGTYQLIPSKSSSVFAPLLREVTVSNSNLTGQNFTLKPAPDMGFRPNPNGYSFENYLAFFPLPPIDFDANSVVQMFGTDAACAQPPVLGVCVLKQAAIEWELSVHWYINGGHCDGMSSTSLRFFKGIDSPGDVQWGAGQTHDLWQLIARRHIAFQNAKAMTNPVATARSQSMQKTPAQVLDQIVNALAGGAPDPVTMMVYSNKGGHAIVPYAVSSQGNGIYWVSVYDNNHPDDANRHVTVNLLSNTWSYDMGSLGVWTGTASSHTFGVYPVSKYSAQPVCPWCGTGSWRAGEAAPEGQVFLAGPGHLLLTDAQGRRIGYVGDQFVNEIPEAYENRVPGGLGADPEPIYTLPLSTTFTTLIDGQTFTQTGTARLAQFGPGYAAVVSGLAVDSNSAHQVVIAPDGSTLALRPGVHSLAGLAGKPAALEATFTLAQEATAASNAFILAGADVAPGQALTVTAPLGAEQLVVNNALGGSGSYDLLITQITAAGIYTFTHPTVPLGAADTQTLDTSALAATGVVTMTVDVGSTGTVTHTVTLPNTYLYVYLPLIANNPK